MYFPQTDSYRFCHGEHGAPQQCSQTANRELLPGQINKYLANQCRKILWSWGAENIAPAADFRLKKGLCSAVKQRDVAELHERCAASTEFGEILIYLVLYVHLLYL